MDFKFPSRLEEPIEPKQFLSQDTKPPMGGAWMTRVGEAVRTDAAAWGEGGERLRAA